MKILTFLITALYIQLTYSYCCQCQQQEFKEEVKVGLLVPQKNARKQLDCNLGEYHTKLSENFYRHDRGKDPMVKKMIKSLMSKWKPDAKLTKMGIQSPKERLGSPVWIVTNQKLCIEMQEKFKKASRESRPYKSCEKLFND